MVQDIRANGAMAALNYASDPEAATIFARINSAAVSLSLSLSIYLSPSHKSRL